jgi:hypothetical protein
MPSSGSEAAASALLARSRQVLIWSSKSSRTPVLERFHPPPVIWPTATWRIGHGGKGNRHTRIDGNIE